MRQIYLRGPDGNAFALMGIAKKWCKQLERDGDAVVKEMQESKSYGDLLAIFKREFCEGPTAVCELIDGDYD